jgi:hypothetical protein
MNPWRAMLALERAEPTTPTTLKTVKTPTGGGSEGFEGDQADGFPPNQPDSVEVSKVLRVPGVVDSCNSMPWKLPDRVRALLGLNDAELALMAARIEVAQAAGYSDDEAAQIADELLYRDRCGPRDQVMCLECRRLSGQSCQAAHALGTEPDWRPVRHELRKCPAFLDQQLS